MVFYQTPGSHMLTEPLLEQACSLSNIAGRTARTVNLINKVVLEHMGYRGFEGRNFRLGFTKSHNNPLVIREDIDYSISKKPIEY